MSEKPKACILVVDDNQALVESIEAQFCYCGFEIIKATDSARALSLSNHIKPDLIMTDIRMPKLDGIAFLELFKDAQPDVKVICMTGYYPEYEDKIKTAEKSGLVDRVIQKPFYAADLEKLVYEVLKTPAEEAAFSQNSKGKVLIVDDEFEVTDFLKDYLRERHYSAAAAGSAEEAVRMYQNFTPDVMIADIKMPGQDGIWLIKAIQAADHDAKIIAMTGQDSHPLLEQLNKETGITNHFAKPFSLKELENLLVKIDLAVKEQKTKKAAKK